MTISSTSSFSSSALTHAATTQRTADAASVKATARLAADQRAKAIDNVFRADQKPAPPPTKPTQKDDAAVNSTSLSLNVTV